ncbi:MAG: nuclear transport factor 2 family protein [bacterium]
MRVRKWKIKFVCAAVAGFTVLIFGIASLQAKGAVKAMSEGEKLERQIWADIAAKNSDAVAGKLAMGFQAVNFAGVRDYREELKLLKELNVKNLQLSDFLVTQNGPVIVVTYNISVDETIDGKRAAVKSAPRQSVWLRTDRGWKWIAHSNLNPPKQ